MNHDDDNGEQANQEISKLTRAEQEVLLVECVSKMPIEDQIAFEQLMHWVAYDRPKDAEKLTREKIEVLVNDIKRENTRRRLGGRVGVILPFKRPGGEGSTGGEPL